MVLPFQLPHGPMLGKPQTTGVGFVPAKIPGSERLRDAFRYIHGPSGPGA